MIDKSKLSNGNLKFIGNFPHNHKFGIPIELDIGTVYPIIHEKLFLRYYINYSGYIYDIINNSIHKCQYDDIISFITTEDMTEYRCSFKELIWRTFYRFPEGQNFKTDKNGNFQTIKPIFKQKKNDHLYMINGVEFRPVKFKVGTLLYHEFVENTKSKLIVSENGAIYNLKRNQFLMIRPDKIDSRPFIYSKSGKMCHIDKIIAYSWFSDAYNENEHKLKSMAFSELFITADNILIYKEYNGEINSIASRLYLQNLALDNVRRIANVNAYNEEYYISLDTTYISSMTKYQIHNRYGILYTIPLIGFYNSIFITKQGVLFNSRGKVILPHALIFDNKDNISDILYQLPNSDKIYSLLDIYMWTFYRLTKDAISIHNVNILIDYDIGIPIIDDLYVITNTGIIPEETFVGFCIGKEKFALGQDSTTTYHKIYISTHGAIFNIKSNAFMAYNIKSFTSTCKIPIPVDKDEIWINAKYLMFVSWFGIDLYKGARLSSINGITSDISLYNIKPIIYSKYAINNKNYEKTREMVRSTIINFYGVENTTQLANELPIHEIIL